MLKNGGSGISASFRGSSAMTPELSSAKFDLQVSNHHLFVVYLALIEEFPFVDQSSGVYAYFESRP
jgi:hypothetical protein